MRSANLFGPLKGLCPYKALIGLTQASGLAGGFDLFPLFYRGLIIPQGGQGLLGHGEEDDHVENGHEGDTHITQIPNEGVGCHAADEQHYQRQHLIGRLGGPVVTAQVGHIAPGVEQDADERGEAEQ